MLIERRHEGLRLDQDAVASPIDPADDATGDLENDAAADGAGRFEAFGPKVLHPEQHGRPLEGAQGTSNDADSGR